MRQIRTFIARALMGAARPTISFGNLQTRAALRVAPWIAVPSAPDAPIEPEARRTGYWDDLAKEAERACALLRKHEARKAAEEATAAGRPVTEADVEAALTRLARGESPELSERGAA